MFDNLLGKVPFFMARAEVSAPRSVFVLAVNCVYTILQVEVDGIIFPVHYLINIFFHISQTITAIATLQPYYIQFIGSPMPSRCVQNGPI